MENKYINFSNKEVEDLSILLDILVRKLGISVAKEAGYFYEKINLPGECPQITEECNPCGETIPVENK
jgi:hypothetical protein